MNESMQSRMNGFIGAAAKESDVAAARVREIFSSLVKPSQNEITRLEARVTSLEIEVAALKAERAVGRP